MMPPRHVRRRMFRSSQRHPEQAPKERHDGEQREEEERKHTQHPATTAAVAPHVTPLAQHTPLALPARSLQLPSSPSHSAELTLGSQLAHLPLASSNTILSSPLLHLHRPPAPWVNRSPHSGLACSARYDHDSIALHTSANASAFTPTHASRSDLCNRTCASANQRRICAMSRAPMRR